MNISQSTTSWGWQSFFQQQLSATENDTCQPARIIEQYKNEITVAAGAKAFNITLLPSMPNMVVGDWLLLTKQNAFSRLLNRKSCFARKAKQKKQLIAANVDTAFIVCSMNADFSLNRLERFLALVNEAGAKPVVVLSKQDLADTPESFIDQAKALSPTLDVVGINGLEASSIDALAPWVNANETICVLGSSGVGKSTLINTLLGEPKQATGDIRDDGKGKHTTTRRSLIALSAGGLIIDTPGMREIQLTEARTGIEATFEDVQALADQCKFRDCKHQTEPGCAILSAIAVGDLDKRRVDHYLQLLQETKLNTESLAKKQSKNKARQKQDKHMQSKAQTLKDQ